MVLSFCQKKAITLTELIVVVAIIGILSAIAIPGVIRSREKAIDKEAIAILKAIYNAERILNLETGRYFPNTTTEVTDRNEINENLRLGLPPDENWSYRIKSEDEGRNYEAELERKNTSSFLRTWSVSNTNPSPLCRYNCL